MRTAKEESSPPGASANHWLILTTPRSLALFRMLLGICLALDVLTLVLDAPLWFSGEVGVLPRSPFVRPVLGIWLAATLAITLGWKTRAASVLNYACAVLFLGIAAMPHGYEYHNDTVYLMLSFGLMFMPVSDRWALDAAKPKSHRWIASTKLTSVFLALVASAVYFDSGVWKLSSQMWIEGLGYWAPASRPFDAFWPIAWTRETEWVARGIGYATLGYEMLFPILIWVRKIRVPLLLVGLAFHVGIGLVLPLPLFGLLMSALLLAFWPIGARSEPQHAALISTIPGSAIASYFALWAVTFCVGLVDPMRLLVRNGVGGVQHTIERSWLATSDHAAIRRVSAGMTWSYRMFGFRSHPIFLDNQFTQATTQTRMLFIPGTSEGARHYGVVSTPLQNRRFISWSYRMTWPPLSRETAEANLVRFAQYCVEHSGPSWEMGHFAIEQRPLRIPTDHWVAGQLDENLQRPWETVGHVRLVDGAPTFTWMDPVWR